MKSCILLIVVILTVGIQDVLCKSVLDKISVASNTCSDEVNLPDDMYAQIAFNMDVTAPIAKKFLVCYYKRLGILDSNGKFNKAAVREIQEKELTSKELGCLVEKSTLEETAYHYYRCI